MRIVFFLVAFAAIQAFALLPFSSFDSITNTVTGDDVFLNFSIGREKKVSIRDSDGTTAWIVLQRLLTQDAAIRIENGSSWEKIQNEDIKSWVNPYVSGAYLGAMQRAMDYAKAHMKASEAQTIGRMLAELRKKKTLAYKDLVACGQFLEGNIDNHTYDVVYKVTNEPDQFVTTSLSSDKYTIGLLLFHNRNFHFPPRQSAHSTSAIEISTDLPAIFNKYHGTSSNERRHFDQAPSRTHKP